MLMTAAKLEAQNTSSISSRESGSDRFVSLRFNFPGLLDEFDRNISIGGEYLFAKRWSAGMDVAYIFSSKYLVESEDSKGVILRPFARYYFDEDLSGYLEGNLHYKSVNYQLTDWLGKDVANGTPAYEEFTTFTYHKRVTGVDVKIGRTFGLTKDENLCMDVYVGMGLRFKEQGARGGSYTINRGAFINIERPVYTYPSLPMGLRLIYRFKTR